MIREIEIQEQKNLIKSNYQVKIKDLFSDTNSQQKEGVTREMKETRVGSTQTNDQQQNRNAIFRFLCCNPKADLNASISTKKIQNKNEDDIDNNKRKITVDPIQENEIQVQGITEQVKEIKSKYDQKRVDNTTLSMGVNYSVPEQSLQNETLIVKQNTSNEIQLSPMQISPIQLSPMQLSPMQLSPIQQVKIQQGMREQTIQDILCVIQNQQNPNSDTTTSYSQKSSLDTSTTVDVFTQQKEYAPFHLKLSEINKPPCVILSNNTSMNSSGASFRHKKNFKQLVLSIYNQESDWNTYVPEARFDLQSLEFNGDTLKVSFQTKNKVYELHAKKRIHAKEVNSQILQDFEDFQEQLITKYNLDDYSSIQTVSNKANKDYEILYFTTLVYVYSSQSFELISC